MDIVNLQILNKGELMIKKKLNKEEFSSIEPLDAAL